ncbi:Mannosyltransferase related to Gpi18 [Lishizhenia tianjinensis]|uniref:Mannosyltransferase related to Gpi18 n=1 Tax=Lishizhenia tianjinensis TaxID=477690 RepID=A0A1I7BBX8_9FLAO|nr:hypothetical protein [Lishizhenia tianjinensis]SFT84641.1 Mannosyltransferase related to Gpi18 [Lishizhenia tianjinensis]
MSKTLKNYLLFCLLLLSFFWVIMPTSGHGYDTYCWRIWTEHVFHVGLPNIYYGSTDYLPLYHYILMLYGEAQGSVEAIGRNLHYLKLVTLCFQFVSGYFLIKLLWTSKMTWERALLFAAAFLLNIAVMYNTLIWGQVDGILTCFVFIAIYYAYKKRVVLSLIFTILALNFKLQGIIFLPLIVLLLLPVIKENITWKKVSIWVLVPLNIQLLILLPFIYSNTLGNVWNVVSGSFGKYPSVSMNAYNFWFLLFDGDLMKIEDSTLYLGLSYKQWGLLLFFAFSFLTLWPLLLQVWRAVFNQISFNFPMDKMLLIAALIPLLFFFFNTQMHERYSHPALIFLIAYGLLSKRFLIPVLGCMAYFLNMEDVFRFLALKKYGILFFDTDFIAALYLLCILLLLKDLYGIRFFKRERKLFFFGR